MKVTRRKVVGELVREDELLPGDVYVTDEAMARVGLDGAAVYMVTDERDDDGGDRRVVCIAPGESRTGMPRGMGEVCYHRRSGRYAFRINAELTVELAK